MIGRTTDRTASGTRAEVTELRYVALEVAPVFPRSAATVGTATSRARIDNISCNVDNRAEVAPPWRMSETRRQSVSRVGILYETVPSTYATAAAVAITMNRGKIARVVGQALIFSLRKRATLYKYRTCRDNYKTRRTSRGGGDRSS